MACGSAFIHALGHVQHEVGGHADHAFDVGNLVHRRLQLGMLLDEGANLFEGAAGGVESGLEFELGLGLGFAERHLHAAVGVHVAFAGGLDGEEDHVLVVRHHRRLRAVGLRGGHAAERLERENHVRQTFVRVVDVLGDFQVAFAARRARIVVRMAEALQFVLIDQVMADAAQRVDDAVVFALEDGSRRS